MTLSTFRLYTGALAIGLLLVVRTSITAQPNSIAGVDPQTSAVHHLLIQFHADRGSLNRFYIVTGSPERRVRFQTFYTDYLNRLEALNFDRMNTDSRVDYLLFKRDLAEQLHKLNIEAVERDRINAWFPFADSLYAVEKRRRRGHLPNAQQFARNLTDLAKQISELQIKLDKEDKPDPSLMRRAASTANGLQIALRSVYSFYNHYDPSFSWWIPKPYQQADSLLGAYESVFRRKSRESSPLNDESGIVGVPVGRDELVRQLQIEMIPYSPEELIQIANKEFAWCDRELLKASREMGFGDDWKAAQEKVKNSYVPIGRQPEMVLGLFNESVAFLKAKNLITIPPIAEETWRMGMMSPSRQLVNPFFTGGEELSISYPTDDMNYADKVMSMRGNNPHFSRATVHHELIAGHHLQGFMNNRYKVYRNFDTPFWIEGWALYWEMLLWDQGFAKSPEDRIGMLFWRMHRCARIIFSLNFHLGKWRPQQCVDFLVNRVGHERANAIGEVRRSFLGVDPPLYQLAYMTGGFQFLALKKELVDTGKMTYKQFHDAVLQINSMPVEMIRAILTNQSLPKDFRTKWRFYDLN
ncbi:DUF885 domain-containing protein [Spirosoma sp. RP8]|uniref:DUF885 domain-containing protein n=1 Tax=Spirosoma liriopis TaxID=2937440 RepID=A0ABT0HSV9_9BACT|nr:DUF885 family protein [Spirosoma liriopis]MCK8494917.1 DUF885 domain-containing protein [Spirosoma liriopis]